MDDSNLQTFASRHFFSLPGYQNLLHFVSLWTLISSLARSDCSLQTVVSPGRALRCEGRETTASIGLLLWSSRRPALWTNKLIFKHVNPVWKQRLGSRAFAYAYNCCLNASPLWIFSISLDYLFLSTYFVKCRRTQMAWIPRDHIQVQERKEE